jgi:hypothetical protein
MSDENSDRRQRSHEDEEHHGACAFVLGGAGAGSASVNFCNAPGQPGSAYCPPHHASCHLANGSAAERRQLREIEALAEAVGGKQGRVARHPPARLLRRLDRVARASRPSKDPMIVLLVLENADGGTAHQ